MPVFETPEPITATIDVPVGDAGIRAGDRRDTSVEVRPSDPSSREDVEAAEGTRVELSDGKLLVRVPRPRALWSRTAGASVDVTVALPAGSYVRGTSASADFRCDGRLGDCRIKTGIGHIRVEEADTLYLKCGAGDISVDRVTGHAEVTTGSGDVRLRELDRGAVVKNANGDVWIGAAGGEVRVKAANGSVTIDAAAGGVDARSANGDVRLGEAVRGAVTLATRAGDVELGVRAGSAAWLDVTASGGKVYNELDAVDAPAQADERIEVRARTSLGNVVVRRP
jgi:hypothetical protein